MAGGVEDGVAVFVLFVEVNVCRHTTAVSEQVADDYAIFAVAFESGDVLLYGCVEIQAIIVCK